MKFCSKCGNEIMDEAVICPKCGCACGDLKKEQPIPPSGLKIAAKVFMVIGTVCMAFLYLIPLCWCLPMTIIYFGRVNRGEKISVAFKVCSLIFVNIIAGILMLCDKD